MFHVYVCCQKYELSAVRISYMKMWRFADLPDDEGSAHLWNVGLFQLGYTALYPRKLSPSYSPPWEPELLQL
jgi:hypothetical protein